MSKPKLLNVRKHLEWAIESYDSMLKRNGKDVNGLRMPPIDVQNMIELRFFAQAILRHHAAKKTRKDVYVNA